jgi:hypothetical protein
LNVRNKQQTQAINPRNLEVSRNNLANLSPKPFLGDNDGDWACDCRPAYLYYPQDGKCYEAFTRGPCISREILVLPKGKFIPVCERTNCDDGKVRFLGACAKVGTYESCRQPRPPTKSHMLQVNATTIQLYCGLSTNNRGSELINEEEGIYEEPACFLGSKRQQENACT